MKSRELVYIQAALADRCGRTASVSQATRTSLRIVLEPVGDRGRLDLLATLDGDRWKVNDRGMTARAFPDDFAFIVAKLAEIDTPVWIDGQTIGADADDVSLVESVAQFVSNIEFIPVLAGLWSAALTAA